MGTGGFDMREQGEIRNHREMGQIYGCLLELLCVCLCYSCGCGRQVRTVEL